MRTKCRGTLSVRGSLVRFLIKRGPGNSKKQFCKSQGAVPCHFIFLYVSFLIQNLKIYQSLWNTEHSGATGGCQHGLFLAWNWASWRNGRGSQRWVQSLEECIWRGRVAQHFRVKEPTPPSSFCWIEYLHLNLSWVWTQRKIPLQ